MVEPNHKNKLVSNRFRLFCERRKHAIYYLTTDRLLSLLHSCTHLGRGRFIALCETTAELLLADLQSVQPSDRLGGCVGVFEFTECVPFVATRSELRSHGVRVLREIEALQRPERRYKILHLQRCSDACVVEPDAK